jgi:hypothetical protein
MGIDSQLTWQLNRRLIRRHTENDFSFWVRTSTFQDHVGLLGFFKWKGYAHMRVQFTTIDEAGNPI